MFQSTHPHGVRPIPISNLFVRNDVSIHAPTRGATIFLYLVRSKRRVSIHAPTRGATILQKFTSSKHTSFNPRTHTGCDSRTSDDKKVCSVSIHAPTRGATFVLSNIKFFNMFQSTHPHGVRLRVASSPSTLSLFQSTHPHGVRHKIFMFLKTTFLVSIHAPTRGATSSRRLKSLHLGFQSTHPHGVRLRRADKTKDIKSFNPRTHTGCD